MRPSRRLWTGLYLAAGAVQVVLAAIVVSMDVALALTPSGGLDALGAALRGLVVGAVVGAVAAVLFLRLPVPARAGSRAVVLAALLVAWVGGLALMEWLD